VPICEGNSGRCCGVHWELARWVPKMGPGDGWVRRPAVFHADAIEGGGFDSAVGAVRQILFHLWRDTFARLSPYGSMIRPAPLRCQLDHQVRTVEPRSPERGSDRQRRTSLLRLVLDDIPPR